MLAAAAAAALLFAPVAAGLARQWYDDPASSHGLILIIAAAVVLWRRWGALRALPQAPANTGLAALAFALLIFVAGSLAGELFVLRIAMVAAVGALVLSLYGARHLRTLAAPLGLLLLSIPLPAVIVTTLTLPLQLLASQIAAASLTTVGIDVARTGNILTLSNVSLEVADACSGLRSIVSLVAMVAVFKALGHVRTSHALLLVLATVPIAIVGNGLRVTGTGVLARLFGAGAARGFVHDLTGYVAFAVMCAVLVCVYRLMLRCQRPTPPAEQDTCESPALAW